VVWGKAKEMEKVAKILKRDSDGSCNNQVLSGNSRYGISNCKELIINKQQQQKDDDHNEEKELAAAKLKKPVRESEKLCCQRALINSPVKQENVV